MTDRAGRQPASHATAPLALFAPAPMFRSTVDGFWFLGISWYWQKTCVQHVL